MPLVAWAVSSYVAGLLAGFRWASNADPVLSNAGVGALVVAVTAIGVIAALSAHRRGIVMFACALIAACGVFVARDAARGDAACVARALSAEAWSAARAPSPCATLRALGRPHGALERWRLHAGVSIDTLFGSDAPLVRALLIADQAGIPVEMRDRFAAAGLVHMLSISGLHVAVIAGGMLIVFEALRLGRRAAMWGAVAVTLLYVAGIGAPPPALRSATLLGATAASRALQRPVSPWATLALGAAVPLHDPRVVLDIGWQLSVGGYAALTAAGIWTRRHFPVEWRGWRRTVCRDLAVSILASAVTAPIVAWTFGRVSLVAPLTNLAAGPVMAALQPALFLAMILAPVHGAAALVADAARPLLHAFDGVAAAGASVPFASLDVAPTLATAVAGGLAGIALVVAASSRRAWPPLVFAAASVAGAAWWPLAARGSGVTELHMIDVGQGDAIAARTPRGRWLLFDAGRNWRGGDAARATIVPYLRRFGGDVTVFVLSHPHADHVGGAATALRALRPAAYRDAAFAGGSASYRASLQAAATLGVPWARVHPDDSIVVDGVVVRFLAPDSAWTAHLTDPNLASTVALVRYGSTCAFSSPATRRPRRRRG